MLPLQKAIHLSHCCRKFKKGNQQNFGPAICFRIIEFLACSICWSKEWHLQVLWTFALFHPFGELWTLQRRDFFLGGMRFLGRRQWSPTVPTTMVLVMEWAILRPDGRKDWDLRFRLWFVWSYKPGCTQGGLTKTLVELHLARGTLRRFFLLHEAGTRPCLRL